MGSRNSAGQARAALDTPPACWEASDLCPSGPLASRSEPWVYWRAGTCWPLLSLPTAHVPDWVLRKGSPWGACEQSQEVLQPRPQQWPVPRATVSGQGPSSPHGGAWSSPRGTYGHWGLPSQQAGSGKVGAEEGWEVGQGMPWGLVLVEGTGVWEALTPTGRGPGLSAGQLPCSMLKPW